MRYLLLLACLLLLGCTSERVVYKPVKVETPVYLRCPIVNIAKPGMPTKDLTPKDTLFNQVKATLVEIELRQAYEASLEAAVRSCTAQE